MERIEGKASAEDSFDAHQKGLCLLSVMDLSGDFRLTWDPMNQNEVNKARTEFDRLKKAGYLLFRRNIIDPDVKGVQVDDFNRWDGELIVEFEELPRGKASEMVAVPPMQGG